MSKTNKYLCLKVHGVSRLILLLEDEAVCPGEIFEEGPAYIPTSKENQLCKHRFEIKKRGSGCIECLEKFFKEHTT